MSHKPLNILKDLDKTMKPLLKSLEERKQVFDSLINNMPEEEIIGKELKKEIDFLLKNLTPQNALNALQRLREIQDVHEDNNNQYRVFQSVKER